MVPARNSHSDGSFTCLTDLLRGRVAADLDFDKAICFECRRGEEEFRDSMLGVVGAWNNRLAEVGGLKTCTCKCHMTYRSAL